MTMTSLHKPLDMYKNKSTIKLSLQAAPLWSTRDRELIIHSLRGREN